MERIPGGRCKFFRIPGEPVAETTWLCYLTGLSRWVAALELVSPPFTDSTPIWKDEVFASFCYLLGLLESSWVQVLKPVRHS
jgi:hypothetical protein